MKNYRFLTSLGYVYLDLDEDSWRTEKWKVYDDFWQPTGEIKESRINRNFVVVKGDEIARQLYDGDIHSVIETPYGLFVTFELSDGHYGSPEYKLEEA